MLMLRGKKRERLLLECNWIACEIDEIDGENSGKRTCLMGIFNDID